jgi:NADPH-dependent curcumin reductase CurA
VGDYQKVCRCSWSHGDGILESSEDILTTLNHKFELAARPVGLPKRSDWKYAEEPVREVRDGELLVKILYISLDPAMRGWCNETKSYVPPVGIGEVMRAGGLGRVVESKNQAFAFGDYVTGMLGVQEYAISDGKGLNKIDPKLAPLPAYLGGLGMTGMTAYFGLLDVGQPKAGETVVISGAAGATGMIAGQIAKIKGCRAVGIAGGPAKCEFIVKELGFDAAIDYKAEDVRRASTSISITLAVKSSMLRSHSSPVARASFYAARSLSTTTQRQSKVPRTTYRFSSIAPL